MREVIAYWAALSISAVATTPSFLGGNWIGVFLSLCFYWPNVEMWRDNYSKCVAAAIGKPSARQRLHLLWESSPMRQNLFLALKILFCFWLGNCLQLAYLDVSNARSKLSALQDSCVKSQESASVTCTNAIADLKTAVASEKARSNTLEKQNNSQRNTIDNFGSQIIKATIKPEIYTPLHLDLDTSNAARKHMRSIVLTNHDVSPIRLDVTCDQTLIGGDANVIEAGVRAGSVTSYKNLLQVRISSPSWTPVAPLLIDLYYSGQNPPTCNYQEQ